MWRVYEEVRGQLSGIRYLLPPLCGCGGSNWIHRAWQQTRYLVSHHTHRVQMIFKSVKWRKVTWRKSKDRRGICTHQDFAWETLEEFEWRWSTRPDGKTRNQKDSFSAKPPRPTCVYLWCSCFSKGGLLRHLLTPRHERQFCTLWLLSGNWKARKASIRWHCSERLEYPSDVSPW